REEMRAAAVVALTAQGYAAAEIAFSESIDLRLESQEGALSVGFDRFDPEALRPAFLAAYREAYGYTPTDAVEASTLRLRAEARTAAPLDFRALRPIQASGTVTAASRPVRFARGEAVPAPVLSRDALTGPA